MNGGRGGMISEKEYDKLIKRLEFFDTMRNNLLTFSFTAVLAILGVALTIKDMNEMSSWLCLAPFCLIVPFAARISYYRLASAHINSFLRKFAGNDMKFEIGTLEVTENACKLYSLIAWLVNHEMVMLSLATSGIFYLKYTTSVKDWTWLNRIGLIVPILLIILVYLISHSTNNYQGLLDDFEKKWEIYNKKVVIK